MAYCHKCGQQVEDGDKFCTGCGARLIEDSNIETKQSSQDEQFAAHKNTYSSNVEGSTKRPINHTKPSVNQTDFSGVGHILFKMIVAPVSGAKQFVRASEKTSVMGVTFILAVLQGLIGVWKVNQVISSLQSTVISLIKQMGTIFNLIEPGATDSLLNSKEILNLTGQIGKVKAIIDIPYGTIFLQNIIMFIVAIIILFIIIYLGANILSQNKNDGFKIYKIALITLVPIIYFEILSVIFSYLSFYIGIVVAVIGVIVSLASLTIVINEELDINENHCTFIVAGSFTVIFIIVSVCLQKFMVSNISHIIMSVTSLMKNLNY